MRKSEREIGGWTFRAGVVVAATAVVTATGVAVPAFASPTALLQTTTAPIGGGTTITAGAASSGSFPVASAASVSARLVTSTTTCPSSFGTSGTAATVSSIDNDDSVDVVVPNVTAGTYKFCFYGVGSGSVASGTLLLTSSDSFTVSVATTKAVLNSPAGTPAGGNTITAALPGPWLTSTAAPGALFTTATCPTTYATTTGNITATATKNDAKTTATVTVPTTLTLGSGYNVCFYAGTTAGTSALIGSTSTTYTTRPITSISPAQGSSATVTNVAIGSSVSAAFLSASTSPGVLFTRNSCPATYDVTDTANKAGTSVVKISSFKLSAKVPTSVALAGSEATATYNVCTYAGTSGDALVGAPTTYTIAPTLTVTGVASTTMGGPAQGGTAVTILGSGFPTDPAAKLTASFGNSEVTVDSVANDGTKIYGHTTAHAPGTLYPTVVTAAGSQTPSSGGNQFTFSYGITVAPSTAAPATASTPFYVDVLGAGFDSLSWPTTWSTGIDAGAHVFLLDNTGYDATWAAAPITDCYDVIKISDGELICKLDLYKTLADTTGVLAHGTGSVPVGTYTIAVVADASAGSQTPGTDISDVSSGSTFTVSNY